MSTIKSKAKKSPENKPIAKTELKETSDDSAMKKAAASESAKATASTSNPVDENVVKKETAEKTKVIRDKFAFSKREYKKLKELKKTCIEQGVTVKKGEVIRAGLNLLANLSVDELKLAIGQVEKL